ncbi:quinone oxidoreductase [Arcticibacter svalbardensis MN12-7]|uniref:Quinone oxidoreductase n=1 Tax=Arcticibacter svalbardensis MN12-7 TaxID=1150600 RepID=R9GZ31_9SPHI|nr:quinone oxidoreductase [Arcticibacter svalbardensis]EOR96745.1 quinone oxidoreductase [Arcticibacter svalbardensis MN12-7]
MDKLKAAGKHYTKYPILPAIVGLDGIARLKGGTHVYVSGVTGTMSEKALIVADSWTLVPQSLPIPLAAALPNALLGSDVAMLYLGGLKKGGTVMIQGATGATGRIAIQMAKNRGADCIIAIGRASSGLSELSNLGADIRK